MQQDIQITRRAGGSGGGPIIYHTSHANNLISPRSFHIVVSKRRSPTAASSSSILGSLGLAVSWSWPKAKSQKVKKGESDVIWDFKLKGVAKHCFLGGGNGSS